MTIKDLVFVLVITQVAYWCGICLAHFSQAHRYQNQAVMRGYAVYDPCAGFLWKDEAEAKAEKP